MAIYFSLETEGFYNTEAGVTIPDDAIEITEKQYNQFLYAFNNENKKLVLENKKLVLRPRESSITWDVIRIKRDRLLSQSDYTQMPDWPGDKAAWANYRRKLRDITDSFNAPHEVIWPKAPT